MIFVMNANNISRTLNYIANTRRSSYQQLSLSHMVSRSQQSLPSWSTQHSTMAKRFGQSGKLLGEKELMFISA